MTMPSGALLKYNFRVLMSNNWWLLVIPVAVTQLTVFWTAATQRFKPALPAMAVELISPLLAAFLCAHLLTAEYRSGIGAVLASKPVDIGKVVFVRLSIAISLVWALGWLALLAFYYGMEPYPMLKPGLAFMISSLFLALLALTFATLFRHPLAGFGVAALYWVLDLPSGPPINPFLSVKSLANSFPVLGYPEEMTMTDAWWVAKAILLLAALALYVLHQRLLFLLGSPLTMRRRRRALLWAGGIFLLYIVTGASAKAWFGYQNRGKLPPSDAAWFRRQFSSYAPLPIPSLFGPNFQRYLGAIPSAWRLQSDSDADLLGDTAQHQRDLDRTLEIAPNSVWAASVAELKARFGDRARFPMEERLAGYRLLRDRYANSPYTPYAMQQIARIYATETREKKKDYEQEARSAYEALLTRFPMSEYRSEAYRFLAESDRLKGDLTAAADKAQQWIAVAPVYDKFQAWMLMAEIQRDAKRTAEAKAAYQEALKAIVEFRRANSAGTLPLSEPRRVRIEKEAVSVEQRAKEF